MRDSKRLIKENNIIEAAERVFASVGFKNAKMEDIAKEAGVTKVTVYAYFQSKENLYMAITFKALTLLNENYYLTLNEFKNKPGVESVIALLQTFMSFCEDNYLYSEALLDYFAMVRSTSSGKDQQKLTDALKDSLYYRKLQDVQNLPFKLTAREIQRGQQDGSILHKLDPMLLTLHGWTTIVGYIKVVSANGSNASPLFNVSLTELKALHLKVARALLTSSVVRNELNRID